MNTQRIVKPKDLAAARLVQTEEAMLSLRRRRRGTGWSYIDGNGQTVSSTCRERLETIAVPPSYTDVRYCQKANGHLQATGIDGQGHKQYFYHAAWESLRERLKFSYMRKFGETLPALRRKISARIHRSNSEKERLLCGVVRILDQTGMRIGNEKAAKQNGTYGLTTLRKKHIDLDGAEISFNFTGKAGAAITCNMYDPRVAGLIDNCIDISGSRLFDYHGETGDAHHLSSDDVNRFIQDCSEDEFSAKDFRTWRFSCLFIDELINRGRGEKLTLKGTLETIAEQTCNTPAILQSSYIHPGLIEICKENKRNYPRRPSSPLSGLSQTENYLLTYCRSRHAREVLAKL